MKKFISVFMSLCMTLALATTVLGVDGISPATDIDAANGVINGILGFVQVIGTAFAIGMLIYVGIKYTMSSANEKADLKKGSINYVIGAIVIFAASTVVGIIKELGGQIVT